MKSTTTNLLAFASTAYAYTASTAGSKSGCYWNVPGSGQFNTRMGSDFSVNLTGTVENLLPSTYTVLQGINPLARRFDIVNIGLDPLDQAITLTVPGGQSNGPISVAQLQTSYDDILYASVRTVAKISNVPGTTHGFIFYSNDTQEVDFAFLTSDISKAWLTNEQVTYTSPYSTYSVGAPADAHTAWHEYRVDWLPGVSKFYIDGVLIQTITDNVPTTPGSWIWNNWSNGNAWAQGPPTADSVLKIRSIDAYFNRTSVADQISTNPDSCPVVASSSSVAPSSTAASSSSSSSVARSSSSVVSSSSSSVRSSSSSSSSSSVAPTTSSVAPTSSLAAPATVSFTTVTTAWTGTYTTTSTAVNGLSATVYVQTPVQRGQVVSTSTAKASYTTVTTHSGTATTVAYVTATPNRAGATTTVTVVYPTPNLSCGNQGINVAAYSNAFSGGQATYGYPKYSPEYYKTVTPLISDDTTYIAESNNANGDRITLYGYSNVDATNLVLDHTFYLFASQTGYYSLNIPYTDDIQFVWIGSKAVSGWTRANADITQFWSSQIATQTPQTLAYYLTVGTYVPVRVQWANGGGQGDLRFNIYAPDGSSVLSSTAGANAGTSSIDIVKAPCNKALGAAFPAWGKET